MSSTKLLYLSAFALILCSCADTMHVYVPNAIHTPLLQEKNEVKGSVGPGNAQVAFSVSDHVGVMVNGHYLFRDPSSGLDGTNGFLDSHIRGGMLEAGAGYFVRFDRNRVNSKVLEVYAGYGRGGFTTLSYDFFLGADTANASRKPYLVSNKLERFFIQPAFGYVSRKLEFSGALRLSLLHFNDSRIGDQALLRDARLRRDLAGFSNKWMFAPEPSVTIKTGFRNLKFMAQIQLCIPFSSFAQSSATDESWYEEVYKGPYFQPLNVQIGAAFHFARWLNEKR